MAIGPGGCIEGTIAGIENCVDARGFVVHVSPAIGYISRLNATKRSPLTLSYDAANAWKSSVFNG